MGNNLIRASLLATAAFGMGSTTSAIAQTAAADQSGTGQSVATTTNAPSQRANAARDEGGSGDIIVTARRVEERLQDVPISITVFTQQQLANKNLTDAGQLATYTPSLSSNNNFGGDNTTFAIRGFAQDVGTAPSVGTYFGDVVAPRGGSNGQPIGDNASPGDFFDLQNVQVLKGPQGTLFGRNTTGGAVLFVPQKPTSKFEGYAQAGYGNHDMKRFQGMVNIPINDTFKVRAAFDHMDRNGWLHSTSGIGPKDFNNTNYWAGRVSVVADLTPNLENYLIVSYTRSTNHGGIDKLVAANATQGPFGQLAAAQLARQNADGRFYITENALADAGLMTTQFQIINNTQWHASDSITVRNIASYAELRQGGVNPIFGQRFIVPTTQGTFDTDFQQAKSPPNGYTANEATITEEFRLEGTGSRFNWQAGVYAEFAEPLSTVGSQSPGFAHCTDSSRLQCNDPIRLFIAEEAAEGMGLPAAAGAAFLPVIPSIGNINYTVGKNRFRDLGAYAQGTYNISDKFKVTAGIRYTSDKETIDTRQLIYTLPVPPAIGATGFGCFQPLATYPSCTVNFATKSKKPTWLIDFDYTPTQNILVYAKYARGYRAATIAPNIPIGGTAANPDYDLNYVRPEKVDAYELGLKSSFGGALHATFNVAGFYNKFSDQQLQVGFLPIDPGRYPQTAAPVNAGASTIYGLEAEGAIRPFEGVELNAAYTYLHTRIDKVIPAPSNPAYNTQAAFVVGDSEILSPRHKFTVGANYMLPLDPSAGRLTVGVAVTYRSSELSNYISRANPDPTIARFSTLPSLTLVDLSANWTKVAGSSLDISLFATNVTGKKYYSYVAGLGSSQLGFEVATVGEPRMFGGNVKYHF
jgi:iron complex outermembrane receptor protein